MTQFEKEKKVKSTSELISSLLVIGFWFILALIFTIKGCALPLFKTVYN